MAPNVNSITLSESVKDTKHQNGFHGKEVTTKKESSFLSLESKLVWRNVIVFILLHIGCFYGFYLCFTTSSYYLYGYTHIIAMFGGFGITAGAHRLWSHKAYKAKLPMRIFLMVCQTLAFQNSIYEWVRDHRVHHKHTDTNADPHNSKRGFFFSHMGWLMMKKHPDVTIKGRTVDMSDLEEDAVVMFQKKHYLTLMPLIAFVLPALPPYFIWGYSMSSSFFICSLLRYTVSLHFTWLVNSAAHMWGTRPYDKNISAVNSLTVAIFANGEGWHNYHHVFPWDYKAAEVGSYGTNYTTCFIDVFAYFGLAYDLKTVSDELIQQRCLRTGDGRHRFSKMTIDENNNTPLTDEDREILLKGLDPHKEENMVWGWDDKDMTDHERKLATIYKKSN